MSEPSTHDDALRDDDTATASATDTDPHGRDHGDGLAGAERRDDVQDDERFANSRDDGVVDKHNYLDDVGEAVASTLGSVIGQGDSVDDEIEDEQRGKRKPADDARQ